MDWRIVETPTDAPAEVPDDLDARKPGFRGGDVVGIIAAALLLLVFGSDLVMRGIALARGQTIEFSINKTLLWINAAMLTIMMLILPVAWLWSTRKYGWRGVVEYLQLNRPLGSVGRSAAVGTGIGIGVGVGLLLVVMLVGAIMVVIDQAPENPAIDSIAANLDWALVIVGLSLVPAVAEEVLFRGILQRFIGVWGQGAVFGLLHVYEGFVAVFITGLVGIVFGMVMKKRWGLWICIAGHFVFNFTQLALLMLVPDAVP